MLKKIFIILTSILAALLLGGAIWFFTYAKPRHYEADDFDVPLVSLRAVAENLRTSGKRGALAPSDWPLEFQKIGAADVRVYPSGVLVKLHGVFTLESGLYFPSEKAAAKISAKVPLSDGSSPVYINLMPGVFSYKIAN